MDDSKSANAQNGVKVSKLTFITVLYVMLLIISNLMATKMILVGSIVLTSAVFVYPFCFMAGDILTEVWGFKVARTVILLGFVMNLFLIIMTNIAIIVPGPAFAKTGAMAFATIFGAVPRITFASFCGYLAGEFSNSATLLFIRKYTGHKWFFMRTIGSSVVGQILDTGLFITIAFLGTMPMHDFIVMLFAQYVIKILCEALGGTPLAYALRGWATKNN